MSPSQAEKLLMFRPIFNIDDVMITASVDSPAETLRVQADVDYASTALTALYQLGCWISGCWIAETVGINARDSALHFRSYTQSPGLDEFEANSLIDPRKGSGKSLAACWRLMFTLEAKSSD